MKYCVYLAILSCSFFAKLNAQPTFKIGWDTYKAGIILHEYTYTFTDTSKITLTDSAQVLVTPDSLIALRIGAPGRDKAVHKTATFYNAKKQVVKTEEFKDDNLLKVEEWRYDDKNRKSCYLIDDKVKGVNYKKLYEYEVDKKSHETVVSECSYYNGKIEFYTKDYYDRNNVKQKEVRLNDNNKDVVHIESYIYGDNGKVKERSVYFPEWHVTKKFPEKEGSAPDKCYKCFPLPALEKINLNTRMAMLKRLIIRNTALLSDADCKDFEYTFSKMNCEVIMTPVAGNTRRIVYRFRERLQF